MTLFITFLLLASGGYSWPWYVFAFFVWFVHLVAHGESK